MGISPKREIAEDASWGLSDFNGRHSADVKKVKPSVPESKACFFSSHHCPHVFTYVLFVQPQLIHPATHPSTHPQRSLAFQTAPFKRRTSAPCLRLFNALAASGGIRIWCFSWARVQRRGRALGGARGEGEQASVGRNMPGVSVCPGGGPQRTVCLV